MAPLAVPAHARPLPVNSAQERGWILLDGDGFNVMNVQLVIGSRLVFANPGDEPLALRIVTWRGAVVKNLTVAAHAHAAWKPRRYGVYDYFDASTTAFGSARVMGAGDRKIFQPVARTGSKSFPAPAFGVVAVTNAAGGGIPLSGSDGSAEAPGTNQRAAAPDGSSASREPRLEVSGVTMTFEPWVLVVRAGQRVEVYNADSMVHGFYPGAYRVMYEDQGRIRFYRYRFDGFDLKMNGGHRSVTFHHPGIHPVVCLVHTVASRHTYSPLRSYGGFPYVMDAFIVVEPRKPRRTAQNHPSSRQASGAIHPHGAAKEGSPAFDA